MPDSPLGQSATSSQGPWWEVRVPGACPHCSSPFTATVHGGPCPRVKAIEYNPDGTVKRIEFNDVAAPPEPPVGASGQSTGSVG